MLPTSAKLADLLLNGHGEGNGSEQYSAPAFTKKDVGKVMSIEGNYTVKIDSELRIVQWAGAKHCACSGKIQTVEEKYKGMVQLEDGQEFENGHQDLCSQPITAHSRHPESCWTSNTLLPVKRLESLQKVQKSSQHSDCRDMLKASDFAAGHYWLFMAALSDGLASSPVHQLDQCPGGCVSLDRPFCRQRKCVRPTCDDAKPRCNENSVAGTIARMHCSETCGCGSSCSPLAYRLPELGCAPACLDRAKKVHGSCTDQEVVSPEFKAYIEAVISPSYPGAGESLVDQGCKAKELQGLIPCSDPGFPYGKMQLLGLRSFCPVACKCTRDLPGCPTSCPIASASPTSAPTTLNPTPTPTLTPTQSPMSSELICPEYQSKGECEQDVCYWDGVLCWSKEHYAKNFVTEESVLQAPAPSLPPA